MPSQFFHVFLPCSPGTPAEQHVRDWLAEHLHSSPAEIRFARDARNRPFLLTPQSSLDINWSHSGDGLLIVLSPRGRIGCDLEAHRPRPRALALARRFFHHEESRWLHALPAAQVQSAFIRLWCAKEAILKAHGHGLSFGLAKLQLTLEDGQLRLLTCDRQLGKPDDWHLQELAPTSGYHAAIAWYPGKPAPSSQNKRAAHGGS